VKKLKRLCREQGAEAKSKGLANKIFIKLRAKIKENQRRMKTTNKISGTIRISGADRRRLIEKAA